MTLPLEPLPMKKTSRLLQQLSAIIVILLILFLTLRYWYESDTGYQATSERAVVSVIIANQENLDLGERKFGLGVITTAQFEDPYQLYENSEALTQGFNYREYKSQLGLQGWLFGFLGGYVPHPIAALRLLNCALMAIVITLICVEIFKYYGLIFSIAFYLITFISARVTDFAPNLYWVEFTWFLPMLLGLICLNHPEKRRWIYPLFFIAFFIKCACGYEFVTTVFLGGIMFLIAEWFRCKKEDTLKKKELFRTILIIGILALLAFATAITLQAFLRGNGDLMDGFTNIYQKDVLRRTFGNADDFAEVYADSLNATVLDVILKYLWFRITGKLALFFLLAALLVIIYRTIKEKKLPIKDLTLYMVTLVTCISWYVFGKSHSYIHTDLNNVMWYMGFMQTCAYIVIRFVLKSLLEKPEIQVRLSSLKVEIDEEIR